MKLSRLAVAVAAILLYAVTPAIAEEENVPKPNIMWGLVCMQDFASKASNSDIDRKSVV